MQIAAYDDVKVNRKQREVPTGTAWRTVFHEPEEGNPATPHAFLVEGTPGRVIKPHYHGGDQYQVVVYGNGLMGKHELPQFGVHFSRGNTPYGPILFGDKGLGFLTLRPKRDVGAQYLDIPENREKLDAVPDRNPWQTTEGPVFEKPAPGGAAVHAFETIRDDRGLASYTVTLAPNARAKAPDATHTNGQYLIIARGSLIHAGKEYKALSVAWVTPQEGAVDLVAGAEGLELLALHFPLSTPKPAAAAAAPKSVPGTRVWQCLLCSFVYDEAKGMPEEGIAPGTPWEDVPETWSCPDCAASKADFQMSVVA